MAETEPSMESTEPTRSPLPNWSGQFAFGLPAGSIRALLALAIIGSLGAMVALHPKVTISDPFRDLSFLILGGYFAHRRSALEPEATGPNPLFLPKGFVRLVLTLAILAVIVFMLQRHESIKPRDNPALYPVFVMIGFLLGVLSRMYGDWLTKRGRIRKRVWADLRATVAILAAAWLILLAWNDSYHFLPVLRDGGRVFPITDAGIRHSLAAVVAFYFGSRS